MDYSKDARSPAVNLLETKILINSIISDAKHKAHFICADIKDHFLATPMKDLEYVWVKY